MREGISMKAHSEAGLSTLRLLAKPWAVDLLDELIAGPRQPLELERRLPHLTHAGLMRLLGDLLAAGALARKRMTTVPPRAYYELTDAGRALLPIREGAEHWELRWSSLAHPGSPGTWTLHLLADSSTRALLQVLSAAAPLRPIELDQRLPGLGRSATRRRLGHLLANGLLSRKHIEGEVRYELTEAARRLDQITTLAARWEWQWGLDEAAALNPPTTPAAPPAPVLHAAR
jgi:DNA-binding HxlR family transcriptional regulator